tara:strand:+ start:474 stop:824 length:351 start_codon:yes stop_codon:yes gene_type:complete
MNEKHDCELCGGKFTYRNKSIHSKTQRHIKAMAPVVVISKVQKYFNEMTAEEKTEMLVLLNAEVVDVDEEKEYEEYLLIRVMDEKTMEQLEIYLKYHTIDGALLTEENKQFIRDNF